MSAHEARSRGGLCLALLTFKEHTMNFARYQHGLDDQQAAPQQPPAPPPLIRPDVGTLRHVNGTAEVASTGVERHTFSRDGVAGGSVVATLNRQGMHATVELEPGNPSSRTRVEVALREGLVERDGSGGFRDATRVAQPEHQAPQEPEQEHPGESASAVFTPEDAATFAGLISDLPQHAFDATEARMVEAFATGRGSVEQIAESLAREAGIEPTAALEVIRKAEDLYVAPVSRELVRVGIPQEQHDEARAFFQSQPGPFRDALQRFVHARDLSGFRALGAAFLARR